MPLKNTKTSEDILLDEKIDALQTDEEMDRAIERQLHRASVETPPVLDGDQHNQLKVEKDHKTLLRHFMDNYKAADTINELEDQVYQAKTLDCDSIEASERLVKYYCKGPLFPERTGFFIYKDVKVYIDGWGKMSNDKTPAAEAKV